MYNASSTFKTKILESSRTIKAYVIIGTTTLWEDDIVSFTIERSIGSNSIPTLGSVVANKLTLKLINSANIPATIVGQTIKPYAGIEVSTGTYEYVPLGIFTPTYNDITKTDKVIDIECFDILSTLDARTYETTLTFPATITQVRDEIATTYGLTFATQTLPCVSFAAMPEGTVRQVIGMIAILSTTCAIANRAGSIEFKFISASGFSIGADNYIKYDLTSTSTVKISQIAITSEGAEDIVYGDSSGYVISLATNCVTTEADLHTIYDRAFPLTYYGYSMTAQGMPHLDVGDSYTFTDLNGVVRTLIIMNHAFTYSGGMKSTFKAGTPQAEVTQVSSTGGSSIGAAMKQYYPTLVAAIDDATRQITGNEGGSVVLKVDSNNNPYEFLILDTNDINTATKVWRWNVNGLGFSSTGYTGIYGTAITSDGQIVADFVSTGVLNANLIKTGILQSADGTSWIDMTNGTFNLGSGKLSFTNNTFTINYAGTALETALNGKASQADMNTIHNYMTFDDAEGLTISKTGSPFQITIDNTQMEFKDSGNVIAYINGQKMYISELEILSSLVVGKHKLEKYASGNFTLIKYVG
jgi:hypothetical protein